MSGGRDPWGGRKPERMGAASGYLVVAFALAAVVLERRPATPADVLAARVALQAQSMLFLAGAAATLWFLGSLRLVLTRAEGISGRLSSVAFGAGLAWVAVSVVGQAFQLGVAASRTTPAPVALLDVTRALFGVAHLPLAVMLTAVAVVTLRHGGLPDWLGWLTAAAALTEVVLWFSSLVTHGALAPGGWLSFALYSVFVVWLLAATTAMVRRPATTTLRRD